MLLLKSYYIFNFIGVFCMPGTRNKRTSSFAQIFLWGFFNIQLFRSYRVCTLLLILNVGPQQHETPTAFVKLLGFFSSSVVFFSCFLLFILGCWPHLLLLFVVLAAAFCILLRLILAI